MAQEDQRKVGKEVEAKERRGNNMSETITKEDHNRDIDRVHVRIDSNEGIIRDVKDSVSSIEKSVSLVCQKVELSIENNANVMKIQQDFILMIKNAVYGEDGKSGMNKDVIKNTGGRITQWWFTAGISMTILVSAIWIIRTTLSQ